MVAVKEMGDPNPNEWDPASWMHECECVRDEVRTEGWNKILRQDEKDETEPNRAYDTFELEVYLLLA